MMKKLWFYTITLLSLLLAGCNNGDDGLLDIPSGWSHNAESLVVTPKNSSGPVGLTQQMRADAVLANSEVVDVTTNEALTWRSSDPSIATIDANGLVTGLVAGSVTISAEGVNNDGSTVKDTATVTVTNAEVVNLLVTPEVDTTVVGLTKPFKATAILSTGATQDVTTEDALSWTSSNTDIATIDADGIATGVAVGEVTITATGTVNGNEFSDTATLTVTNAEVVDLVVTPELDTTSVGLTKPFKATAILSTGATQDVTTEAALSWTSSNPDIATIDANGIATGVAEGEVTITATGTVNGNEFSDTAILTVTNAEVVNLLVTPELDTTLVGLTKPFKATAILSTGATQDVTTEAALSWTSSNTDIATIDANGIATGLAIGEVTITATGTVNGNEFSDTATLTVTNAEVVDLLVTPELDTTLVGLMKPFKATAILSTGETQDVTTEDALSWTSSNTDIATIDANGIATGLAEGEVTIAATGTVNGNEFSDTATLTVTNAEVVDLLVTPELDTTLVGFTKPFKATAILSTGETQDVTTEDALSWTSSNTDIATIDADGIATGVAVGEVTITATGTVNGNEFSDTATLTVTNAEVVDLVVTPELDTTSVGLTKPFKATAILSTGETQDVTTEAALSWTSSNTDIATIDANGIATGVAVGEVTITATGTIDGNKFSDTATLTVIGTRKIVQVNSKSITEDNPLYFQDIPLGNGITEMERFDPLQISLYEVISQDDAKIRRDTVCKLFIDQDNYLDVESNTLKPLDELSTIVEIQERDGLTEGNEFNIALLFTRFGSVPYIRFRFEFDCEGTLLEAFSNIYYAPSPS